MVGKLLILAMPINWSKVPLGLVPDNQLAKRLGVSREWIRRVREQRGIKRAKAGLPRKWTKAELRLLGKLNDCELAERIGTSRIAVLRKRQSLGIKASDERRKSRKALAWTKSELKLLGRVTDAEVAERLGVHIATVLRKRRELGIASSRKLKSSS